MYNDCVLDLVRESGNSFSSPPSSVTSKHAEEEDWSDKVIFNFANVEVLCFRETWAVKLDLKLNILSQFSKGQHTGGQHTGGYVNMQNMT